MAEKTTYEVHRAMHGDGRDYVRGDTREMTAADAATLLESGALSLPGKEPAVRDPAVQHTFGSEPQHSREGYTVANPDRAIKVPEKATAKTAAKAPVKKAD